MVKKVKKKGRGRVKENQNPVATQNPIAQQDTEKVNTPEEDGVIAVNDSNICPHIGKSIDVEKLSAKRGSLVPVKCEDCRDGATNRRAMKAKGKRHGKKKAIWICLECGHFSCGGAGFPTTPQSHAVRHAKQCRHHLAMQFGNPQLRWCFPCNRLILEQTDALQEIAEIIKGWPNERPSPDIEDVWFGTRSIVRSEIHSEVSVENEGGNGYLVKGLVNLGNTCFFNSIIQNLLAMNRLRDYFLKVDDCTGPLTADFMKLFAETSPEDTSRNAMNPKSFFSSICAKAPQFGGYQEQDSHELLRYLLDSLCTEQLSARKKRKSSSEDDEFPLTYVEAIFGGRISSTVTCLECRHSSSVYDPFLDLSLPVPTKKPPSRKAQPVSRVKKSKHPPKRSRRVHPKINRDTASLDAQSAQETTSIDASAAACNMGLTSHNLCSSLKSNNENNVDGITWLDYVDQDNSLCNGKDMASQVTCNDAVCSSQRSNYEQNVIGVAEQLTSTDNFTRFDCLVRDIPPPKADGLATYSDYLDQNILPKGLLEVEEAPLQVRDSEILFLPYKEETSTTSDAPKGQDEVQDGGLFDEPEPVAGPTEKPLLNGFGEATSTVGNSSESDPDEVDNTNAPVSVENCLACFTKPELLSKTEHSWKCENCTKLLRNKNEKNGYSNPENNQGADQDSVFRSSECGVELSHDEACSHLLNCKNGDNVKSGECGNETDSKEGVKVERDATKRILIDKAPPILTIHLKRFSHDSRGRLRKLSGHVNFSDTIDITAYIDPRCMQREVYKYRLIGVVEHLGTMRKGHYVAYIRRDLKITGKAKDSEDYVWYYASDAYVRAVPLEEVLRCEAYILFYEEI